MRWIFRFQVPALLLLSACSSQLVNAPATPPNSIFSKTSAQRFLYSADFTQQHLVSYALPMVSGEPPAAVTTTIVQGIAVYGATLYATTDNAAKISVFSLPLVNDEKPSISIDASGIGAIAAGQGFVYIVTQGSPGTVLAFATPLKKGEAASVTLSAAIDLPSALAIDSKHLYVSNQRGPLASYALPLHNGEKPDATLNLTFAPAGIAVLGDTMYLSRFDTAQLFAFHLPFTKNEQPSVIVDTRFPWTGPLAVTATDLYVEDVQRYAWDYPLPLHAAEHSSKRVKVYPGSGNMIAVRP